MTPLSPKFRILLVGNYRLDQQMSMLRYYDMLLLELGKRDILVSGIEPTAFLGKIPAGPITKWLRYIDKYFLFPTVLKRRIAHLAREARQAGSKLIVHTTDHSNALYLTSTEDYLGLASCHDLLAVRGALGEDTDCPASRFGKILQMRILQGLQLARHVICVSHATQNDLLRLAPQTSSNVIPLPLNQPYSVIPVAETERRLTSIHPNFLEKPFILHVGSSLKRKNREGILRIFSKIAERFSGMLVFAGEKLSAEQRELANHLGIAHRVHEINNPPSPIIEALYNRAYAFLFPSKTEGFGWPIIEAQACGCPVLAARTTSLPEVLGEGGLLRELNDEEGFADDLLALQDSALRNDLIEKGFANLARFGTEKIIDQYVATYQTLLDGSLPQSSL